MCLILVIIGQDLNKYRRDGYDLYTLGENMLDLFRIPVGMNELTSIPGGICDGFDVDVLRENVVNLTWTWRTHNGFDLDTRGWGRGGGHDGFVLDTLGAIMMIMTLVAFEHRGLCKNVQTLGTCCREIRCSMKYEV